MAKKLLSRTIHRFWSWFLRYFSGTELKARKINSQEQSFFSKSKCLKWPKSLVFFFLSNSSTQWTLVLRVSFVGFVWLCVHWLDCLKTALFAATKENMCNNIKITSHSQTHDFVRYFSSSSSCKKTFPITFDPNLKAGETQQLGMHGQGSCDEFYKF